MKKVFVEKIIMGVAVLSVALLAGGTIQAGAYSDVEIGEIRVEAGIYSNFPTSPVIIKE